MTEKEREKKLSYRARKRKRNIEKHKKGCRQE